MIASGKLYEANIASDIEDGEENEALSWVKSFGKRE
jgi:hypothetical protein